VIKDDANVLIAGAERTGESVSEYSKRMLAPAQEMMSWSDRDLKRSEALVADFGRAAYRVLASDDVQRLMKVLSADEDAARYSDENAQLAHWMKNFKKETIAWRNTTDVSPQNGRSILGTMVDEQVVAQKGVEQHSKALLASWGQDVLGKLFSAGLDPSEVMKSLGALEKHAFDHDSNFEDMSLLSSNLSRILRDENVNLTQLVGDANASDATSAMSAIASDMRSTFLRLKALGQKTDWAVDHERQILSGMKATLKKRMNEISSSFYYRSRYDSPVPSSLEEVGLLAETQRLQAEQERLNVRHMDVGSRIAALWQKFPRGPA